MPRHYCQPAHGGRAVSLVTTVAGNRLPRPHPASDAKLSRGQTVLGTSLWLAIPLISRRMPAHGISAKRVAPRHSRQNYVRSGTRRYECPLQGRSPPQRSRVRARTPRCLVEPPARLAARLIECAASSMPHGLPSRGEEPSRAAPRTPTKKAGSRSMRARANASTDTVPASIAGLPIDKRVRRLVHTLNQIPGVSTYSSCGGHRNPSLAQEAAGTFYVELIATSGLVGYRAIQSIIRAIDVFYPYLALTPWLNGDVISWSLRGTRVSPDRVARSVQRACARAAPAFQRGSARSKSRCGTSSPIGRLEAGTTPSLMNDPYPNAHPLRHVLWTPLRREDRGGLQWWWRPHHRSRRPGQGITPVEMIG